MDLKIRTNEPLAAHTTLQVGGPARWFAEVRNVAELAAARRFAVECAQLHADVEPPLVLGGGSNVLISDNGYNGLVIKLTLTGRTEAALDGAGTMRVTVAAGENFDAVVADSVAQGWWGLENLSHIPGSVGATPIQNVGAYGVEVAERIESVEAWHWGSGELRIFSADECAFAYRDSFFKQPAGRDWVVTAVTFRLNVTPLPVLSYGSLQELKPLQAAGKLTPAQVREHVINVRAGKFPDWRRVGTAGSFFKNPIISASHAETLIARYPELPHFPQADGRVKVSLGWVLDHVCGLRGYRVGGVCLYAAQALVLVNDGGATATEINAFATEVAARVADETGITIEREVRTIGAYPHTTT